MREKNLKILSKINEVRELLKGENASVGLVPTMGALHFGHKSLIEKSVEENKITVVSIFVNPTQFGAGEDFDKYPRTLEADAKICEECGVDYVFAPNANEMYDAYGCGSSQEPPYAAHAIKNTTLICPTFDDVDKLCGKSRIGHFDGVATVVGKLFNIVCPTRAYFGKKDAQQLFIIQKMVRDLNFDVEIVPCQIVRESDGLALSSRNTYLDAKARKSALRLSAALFKVQELFENGVNDLKTLSDTVLAMIAPAPCGALDLLAEITGEEAPIDLEYFEIADAKNFEIYQNIDIIKPNSIALIAAKINGVRLIDNIDLIGRII